MIDNQLFISELQDFIEDCRYLKHLGFEERMEMVMDIDFMLRGCVEKKSDTLDHFTLDTVQDHLQEQKWYQNMSLGDKLEVLETFCDLAEGHFSLKEQKSKRWTAEARLILEKEKSRNLYHAIHHAFQWHCGNGSEESEKETMRVLEEAIRTYNDEK